MFAVIYLVVGLVFLLVPHFILPLSFLQGGRSAILTTECSFWYHPALAFGLLSIAAAALRLRFRAISGLLAVLVAILAAGQAVALKSVSFYLQNEENLVILAQNISLRAHTNLRSVLLLLAGILLATAAADLWLARRQREPRASLGLLAVSNLRRKPFRTIALVGALAVVIGAFFTDVLLTRTIGNTLEVGIGRLGADLVVVPAGSEEAARKVLLQGTPATFTLPPSTLERLQAWPEIEKISPQLFFRPFSYLVCCTTEQVLMIGYDPATDFTIGPWVRYFIKKNQQEDELVVGHRVKFYPGQQISLFGKLLTVVASLDDTGVGYFDRSAFMPLAGARKLIDHLKKSQRAERVRRRQAVEDLSLTHLFDATSEQEKALARLDPNGVSALFCKTRPGTDVKALAKRITDTLDGVTVVNVRAATASVKEQLTSVLDALFLPIIILIVMGTVILAAIFAMSAAERHREVGMLRAMGATKREIFQLFLSESLMVAGLGAVFGILAGGAIVVLFKERIMAALNLLYIWPGPGIVLQVFGLTALVATAIGLAAGLYPALAAARLEPYQAIRGR